jgi:hypothetical protein
MDQLAISDENGTTGAPYGSLAAYYLKQGTSDLKGTTAFELRVTIASIGARTEATARASSRSLPDVFNGKAVGNTGYMGRQCKRTTHPCSYTGLPNALYGYDGP